MDKEFFDNFNIKRSDYKEDIEKCKKIRAVLKAEQFDLEKYRNKELVYSPDLSEAQNIINKFALKEIGEELASKDKKKAISYYESLLNNPYFENDYYIYRHLVILYNRTKDFQNQLKILKKFFKSGIYGSNYQYLWFSHKFLKLRDKGLTTDEEINEYLQFYKKNGGLNKDKENSPVILADRIFIRKAGYVDINNQYIQERTQMRYELEQIGREFEDNRDYVGAIDFYFGVLANTTFKTTMIYRKLISAYHKLDDYESMLDVIVLFFKNEYNIGNTTKEWFNLKLDQINEELGTSYTIEDIMELNSEIELGDFKLDNDSIINESLEESIPKMSNDELLFKYAELYEKGLLTREEFDKKKKELL